MVVRAPHAASGASSSWATMTSQAAPSGSTTGSRGGLGDGSDGSSGGSSEGSLDGQGGRRPPDLAGVFSTGVPVPALPLVRGLFEVIRPCEPGGHFTGSSIAPGLTAAGSAAAMTSGQCTATNPGTYDGTATSATAMGSPGGAQQPTQPSHYLRHWAKLEHTEKSPSITPEVSAHFSAGAAF